MWGDVSCECGKSRTLTLSLSFAIAPSVCTHVWGGRDRKIPGCMPMNEVCGRQGVNRTVTE